MRKLSCLFLACLLAFSLCSCESEPEVTSCQQHTVEEPEFDTDYYGNVVFRGKKIVKTSYTHWDENKSCPYQNGYKFRVTKNTPSKILKGDRCDHCKFTWSLHD